MDYKEFKEAIIDSLSENLSEEKQQELEQFLQDNLQYKDEFEAANLFWNGVDEEIPDATAAMDVKFYSMLNAQETKSKEESILKKIENFFIGSFPKQLAYTIVILVIGLFIGSQFNLNKNTTVETIAEAKEETEKVRSELVLTLLEQPSANKRLQAVNEVNKLDKVTETIIKALFSTLNNDENVNVRLSAIEALKNYTNMPIVREGLVASIVHQKSPLVQIALADLMVVLQEKKAVQSFQKLIKEQDINVSAKEKMEESIQSIL